MSLFGAVGAQNAVRAARVTAVPPENAAARRSVMEALANRFSGREIRPPSSCAALWPREEGEEGEGEDDYIHESDHVVETLATVPYSILGDTSGSPGAAAPLMPDLKIPTTPATPPLSSSTQRGRDRFKRATQEPSQQQHAAWARDVALTTKVLTVLSAILQRSPGAHQRSRNFARLLALLADGRFAASAAKQARTLWQHCGGHSTHPHERACEVEALALYCDVLLLIAYHARSADHGETRASSTVAAEETLAALYTLSQEIGAGLGRAAAASSCSAYLRGGAASLTAFCILLASRLPERTLDGALLDLESGAAAAQANMAHMAFMAALPTTCPQKTESWQCRALEVVRRATLYDKAADVIGRAEGAVAGPVVGQVVVWAHGQALKSLLSVMSEAAWCYCTADTLLHMCRAVGAYGATWTSYSASYMSLISFLHRALRRHEHTHAAEGPRVWGVPTSTTASSSQRPSPAIMHDGSSSAAIVLANQLPVSHPSRGAAPPVEALTRRAILGVTHADDAELARHRTGGDGGADAAEAEHDSAAGADTGGVNDALSYVTRCEAESHSPRGFVFYLSLLAYVTSALPSLLGSVSELHLFFYLPRTAPSAPADGTAGASTTAVADAASAPGRDLFALCADLLRANLAAALADTTGTRGPLERQRQLLCESTTTLLCSFMCQLPHALQQLERETNTSHLVGLACCVVTTVFAAPSPSLRMTRLAARLLQRYASAIDALPTVMARLVAPHRWAALDADAEADMCASVRLYQHLCHTVGDAASMESGRLAWLLAELPAGAFSRSTGGAATATALVHAIVTLMEDRSREAALFGGVALTQLPMLVARLGEALDTLVRAYGRGHWVAAGESTWCSACAAASLLYKSVQLYRAPALVATAVFPTPHGAGGPGDDGVRRTRSVVHVLLQLLCDDSLAPAHHVAAELLVAALRSAAQARATEPLLHAFRASLSATESSALAQRVLQAQRDGRGAPSNAMRLEAVHAMATWCPALFFLLFGPETSDDDGEDDGEGATRARAEPAELPLLRLLVETVRSDDAVLYEKALALNCLRACGMTALVRLSEVVTLVPRDESDVSKPRDGERRGGEWEEAAITVACVAFANAHIALDVTRAKRNGTAVESGATGGGGGGGEVDGSGKGAAAPRTPLRRPMLAPLSSLGAAAATSSAAHGSRTKVLASHTDTMDQLLRHATAALNRARRLYDREQRLLHYDDESSWLVQQATRMTLGSDAEVSASVVFPRLDSGAGLPPPALGPGRTPTALSRDRDASRRSALSSSAVPTALVVATEAIRANSSVLNVSTETAEAMAAHQRLFPVGTAATRFFRGTEDDRRLNTLAALLDTMADLATALEQLSWLSSGDTNTTGLFGKRTQQLLESALACVLVCNAGSSLLAPLLARHVQQQLRLARAATCLLERAAGGDGAELLEAGATVQHALRRLVAFSRANDQRPAVVADVLPVVAAYSLTAPSLCVAAEELMLTVQAVLHSLLQSDWAPETVTLVERLVEGCTRIFSRPRSDGGGGSGDALVDSRLLPTLAQVATRLAAFVQPTHPTSAASLRFVRVVECVQCLSAHRGGRTAVLGFLDEGVLLVFVQALGQFAVSSVYDTAAQRHLRLGWHECWMAVLSLWCTVVASRGPFNSTAAGWVPSLRAALLSTPRVAAALSAFAGTHGADRRSLLVWEVEEVDACTRLAAVLAVEGVSLEALTPCVQAGFVFLQRPHLQQHCVASLPSAEAALSEGRRISIAQAHAVRNALTVLLKQPAYAIPRDGCTVAAFVFAPELLGQAPEPATALNTPADTAAWLVCSLDLLRQFTVRELQVLRRVTGVPGAAGALERSPDAGRVSLASRESSATRSPSRGPTAGAGEADAATDVEDGFTLDGQMDVAGDLQSVHLETAQLALTAYVLTLAELVASSGTAPGQLYTALAVRAVQQSTERLIRTLGSLLKELRELRWPVLTRVVQAKTLELQQLVERL
ncbi:hypothetical protein NESM_000222400 [Novymonas esmeraldas]|uniref:Non-specific serine/threonine protein kinase n=1 Tax=Novymonas esmeraldas TaxID=1808958 RepID=A0AAW0F4T7_9TRYP